ncbi:Intraflagellar transport protein 27 [Sparganum proliferum]
MLAFIFDLTDRESFETCDTWIKKIKDDGNKLKAPGVLIGNKSDLSARRKVTENEAKIFAEENGLNYIETSVKENRNVLPPFNKLASQYCDLYKSTSVKFQELL